MHPFQIMLILFAIAALVGFAFILRWEHRQFSARELDSSWLWVRLSTIPIAILTTALVMGMTRGISGMEGLAVFYFMLLAVAPLFWFAAHWVIGRLTKPQLSFGDSARIAATPLVYAFAIAMIAPPLQSAAWSILRWLGVN